MNALKPKSQPGDPAPLWCPDANCPHGSHKHTNHGGRVVVTEIPDPRPAAPVKNGRQ